MRSYNGFFNAWLLLRYLKKELKENKEQTLEDVEWDGERVRVWVRRIFHESFAVDF